MNTDDRIRELYAGVFDEIHASDELLRKVNNMTETTKKKSIRTAVKTAYVAAAAAVLIIAGNVVAYASTGEMLLKIFVNGEERTVSATQVDDGVYTYTYQLDEDSTDAIVIESFDAEDDAVLSINIEDDNLQSASNETKETTGIEPMLQAEIVKEDGRTYLVVNDQKIDITEDYRDGKAEGTIDIDGVTYTYDVSDDDNIYLSSEQNSQAAITTYEDD